MEHLPRRLAPRPVYFLLPGAVAKAVSGRNHRSVFVLDQSMLNPGPSYGAERCHMRPDLGSLMRISLSFKSHIPG